MINFHQVEFTLSDINLKIKELQGKVDKHYKICHKAFINMSAWTLE